MKILAIDTATEACSAALLIDGEIQQRYEVEPRAHTRLILPMVESLLAEAESSLAQLDSLAFGRGPGAFTGVRIAAGVVQGLAYGAGLPVVPVSNLAALAARAWRETHAGQLLTAIDARMQEVYWAGYRVTETQGTLQALPVIAETVVAPDSVPWPDAGTWQAVGTGWGSYQDAFAVPTALQVDAVVGEQLPSAMDIARLAAGEFAVGNAVAPELALPVYLRDKVTH